MDISLRFEGEHLFGGKIWGGKHAMSSCLLLAIRRIDTPLNSLLKGFATMQEYARMSQQRGALLHPPFSPKVKKYVRFYTPMDALLHPHKCAFTPPRNTGKPY